MKVIFNITENKNKATFQQEVVKINTSFNQTENIVKPKFQIGYYPLPVGLENYYTKNETDLLLENYYLKTETYSQDEVDSLFSNETLDAITDRGNTTENDIKVGGLTTNYVQLDTTSINTYNIGKVYWNSGKGTYNFGLLNNVELQLGQEQYVYGKAYSAISNGQLVMYRTSQGGHILFEPANFTQLSTNPDLIIGVATQNIALNDFGYITTFGEVNTLNTSSFADGGTLYFGSGNVLQNTAPTGSYFIVGRVNRSHATQGSIFVKPYFVDGNLESKSNKSDSYTVSSSTTYASTKALVDGLATKLDKGGYTGTASDLVPYNGATQNVNIGAHYFESSQGFKKTGGTSNQALTADGNVFDLTTKADLVDGKVPKAQSQPSTMVMDNSTYVITFTDATGAIQTIDLPLESLFQDANYDETTKSLIVTLQDGTTRTIPLSDLVDLPEIVLATSNPAVTPTSGQKVYFNTSLGKVWFNVSGAWVFGGNLISDTEKTNLSTAYNHSQTTGNPHNTTKSDIGLGNVNNTSDLDKPVSILTQLALDNKVNKNPEIVSSTKTKITYDSKGLVIDADDATTIDINDSIDRRYVTDVQLNTIQNTSGINTGDETTLSIQTKRPLKTIKGESLEGVGNIDLTKNDVGLSNVDNTSDINKPVSTATQTALDLKVDKVAGKQLSTEDYTTNEKNKLAGIQSGAEVNVNADWNAITGDAQILNKPSTFTPSAHTHPISQVDNLQTTLDGKESTISVGTTGQYWRGDKTWQTLNKSAVGLSNVDNTSDANKPISNATQSALNAKADLVNGVIPSSQLPSFVDDVLEFANFASFPATGESGKIYVALNTNLTYRWSGTTYAEISPSLALGETSSTAYRGDRGKTAYDHSQTIGNPHGTTKADIGLGNVNNTSDLDKPISTATQNALNTKADLAVVDNLQIGGRNLVIRHDEKINFIVHSVPPYDVIQYLGGSTMNTAIPVTAGESLMFSKTSAGDNYWRYKFLDANGGVVVREANNLNLFQRIVPANAVSLVVSYPTASQVQIERGNKVTNWSPAPEDKQDRLQGVTGNIGVGKTDASATEKLDVNGNIKAIDIIDQQGISIYLKLKTVNGNVTIDNSYHNKIVRITASCTITIPVGLRTDFNCTFEVIGAYTAQFVDGSGATTSAPFGRYLKTDLTAMFYCTGIASNYRLNGSLTTS